jgi:hypothetical protein
MLFRPADCYNSRPPEDLVNLATLFTFAVLIASSAHAASSCDPSSRDIGTKIGVRLALANGQTEARQFEVTACKNNVFTAIDKTQDATILQYDAGQGEQRRIRFTGKAETSAGFQPVINATWNVKTGDVKFAAPAQESCPTGQHHDASMGGMCMPDNCGAGQHWDPTMGSGMCMPDQANTNPKPNPIPSTPDAHGCKSTEHWDTAMNMCMPGADSPTGLTTMFHYNQFVVLTSGSGARGRTAVSAPNMWMLMLDKKTSARNTIEISWMGTTDLWTVPKRGTPELLQTGDANSSGQAFIDAQHPHSSPIMGLTFSDILSFGANGENKLTFFFAPRGEATAGPEAYMHRASSDGNPDAPLSHHLQDVFHITSTVIGVKADYGKWTVETSAFSGVDAQPTRVNLDMHTPDSFAVRANYRANSNVTVGGSVAKVKALDFVNNPERKTENEIFYSAWVKTSQSLKGGTLSTASIWGQNDNRSTGEKLNSFLEEFAYELGKNEFYGRLEILQRTLEQLEVQVTDGKTGARWVKALTLGAERQIQSRGSMRLYAGGAVTAYSLPRDFRVVYGSTPVAAKVYLRLKFGQGMHH